VTLLGSTTPRLMTQPLVRGKKGPCGCGCALTPATSLGFSLIKFAEDVVGAKLLPWQRWLAIHAFETVHRGGKRVFRYRTILILVARQNGKTTFVELKNLWKMCVLQVPLIIGTAQKIDVAEESWQKALEIMESVPELAAELAEVSMQNGKKHFRLHNGARWKIEPATRGGGRGLSGDDVNLDELREHKGWESWGAVTKTTMARPNAQIWAMTNAGDDRSVVLNSVQQSARAAAAAIDKLFETVPAAADLEHELAAAGIDTTLGLFEWSVPDDVKCTCRRVSGRPHAADCQLSDRALWAMANPALGYGGLTEAALASAMATDPEGIFRTECLCQRVPDLGGLVIDPAVWAALADPTSVPNLAAVTFAVDVTPSGDYASISSYSIGVDDDGRAVGHVELVDHRPGIAWVAERLSVLKARYNPVAITLDRRSPAGALVVDLDKFDIKPQALMRIEVYDNDTGETHEAELWERGGLFIPAMSDVTAGCGQFVEAVRAGTFRHIDQLPLTTAVANGKPVPRSDAWAWGRRAAGGDISPLVAATLARYAHVKLSPKLAIERDYDVLQSVL
jgi:hypothetical protein